MSAVGRQRLTLALCGLLLVACSDEGGRLPADGPALDASASQADRGDDHVAVLAELRREERQRRSATDFTAVPAGHRVGGANPVRVAALSGGRVLLLLRGRNELQLRDRRGRLIDSAPAPLAPRGLSWRQQGGEIRVWVASSLSNEVAHYRVRDDRLVARGRVTVAGVTAFADIHMMATSKRQGGYGLDASEHALVRWNSAAGGTTEVAGCRGGDRLARVDDWLIANCILDHRVVLVRLDAEGLPAGDVISVAHDGPIWSFAARRDGPHLSLVLGGVEDHPLDRSEGWFGYIDSYLFGYRIEAAGATVRTWSMNMSSRQLVTPKALAWLDDERLLVTGYGGEKAALLAIGHDRASVVSQWTQAPGANDVSIAPDGRAFIANPLMDSLQWLDTTSLLTGKGEAYRAKGVPTPASMGYRRIAPPHPDPNAQRRWLGEALVFTTLMAPHNSSDASHSRFSCETCHFEGHSDGRIHHTGRADVHATTKPLRGLFNNQPHFTRAMDADLTRVVHAEFRVAGAGSGQQPWFAVSFAEHPWLRQRLPGEGRSAAELRRALLEYLMQASHEPNPRALRQRSLTPLQRQGLRLFAKRCRQCHRAALLANDATTEVPVSQWPQYVLSSRSPLVWASAEVRKTGVLPYVHEQGARTSSLRRISSKWPYFTNGSADSLATLLRRAGWHADGEFSHQAAASDVTFTLRQQQALLSFIELL